MMKFDSHLGGLKKEKTWKIGFKSRVTIYLPSYHQIYGGYMQKYEIILILNFSQLILSQTLPIIVVDTIIIISWPISLGGVAKLWSSFGSFVYFYILCFQLFFCN